MTVVLDASAILVLLQDEDGASAVEEALVGECRCGAANWSEVAQKVLASGRGWDLVRVLLLSYGLVVDAVSGDDAEWAAARWRHGEGLSPAGRQDVLLDTAPETKALPGYHPPFLTITYPRLGTTSKTCWPAPAPPKASLGTLGQT